MLALPNIKGLIKPHTVTTDNFVFRLHCQFTSLIFFVSAGILVSNQLFGDPIDCFTHGSESIEEAYKNTIDTLCWVTSIFIVKEHQCGILGREVPYAGIGILTPAHTPFDVHVTYRFLFGILALQGLSFFLPLYLWRSWESNKMQMLSTGLANPLIDDKPRSESILRLTNYLLQGKMNGSILYTLRLHICEVLNLVILGLNIWITNSFFRKEFIGYGFNAMAQIFNGSSDDFDATCDDPIKALFPQVAKCNQKLVGPSGNIVVRDHLCVLPLNDFNIHFFKFIWIWFAILLITSVFWLIFRVATFFSWQLRSFLLSRRAGTLPMSAYHLHSNDNDSCCSKICYRVNYSDWIMLMQLGSNMDPLTYKLFLESFCHQLGKKETGKNAKFVDKMYLDLTSDLKNTSV